MSTPTLAAAPGLPPRRALGLLLARGETRPPEQEAAVRQLRRLHRDLDQAVALMHRFAGMIRTRDADALDAWLTDAAQGGLPELAAFVTKLRQDSEAVRAGLTLARASGGGKAIV